jgi:Ala-tRNA(Pro) deacylase
VRQIDALRLPLPVCRGFFRLSSASEITARLIDRLRDAGVEFRRLEHAPVFTSAEAAAARGAPLASGAKALVCKADGQFLMFVLPADRKLASKSVRAAHGWKSLRFADKEELRTLTGLEPGAVPPLGSLFGLKTLCDSRLAEQATINFNAGDHSISISMAFDDYARVEQPELGEFAE